MMRLPTKNLQLRSATNGIAPIHAICCRTRSGRLSRAYKRCTSRPAYICEDTGRSSVRPYRLKCSASSTPPAPSKLADLPLQAVVSTQGYIMPDVPVGTSAFVFAIYDDKQKLQYIGFSKDMRSTLRTVFGRRPDKAVYYKVESLNEVDQQAMLALRDSWYEECGGAPPGNKLAMERAQWQQPSDAGAISARGKQGAAEDLARVLLETIRNRGCIEEFIPDPAVLADGKVEFLAAAALTEEEMQRQRDAEALAAKSTVNAVATVNGMQRDFQVRFQMVFPTNGGYIVDVVMSADERETKHRIVVGKQYYEPLNLEPQPVVTAALAALMRARAPRATEGQILGSVFPVNYFAISELEQWYPDEFAAEFTAIAGQPLAGDIESRVWRWNRIHDYGAVAIEAQDGSVMAEGLADRLLAKVAAGAEPTTEATPEPTPV